MKEWLKEFLLPIRRAASWFANPQSGESSPCYVASREAIIFKAASFVAINKVKGDYLEFGVFRGGSYISAYHTLRHCFDEAIKCFRDYDRINHRDDKMQDIDQQIKYCENGKKLILNPINALPGITNFYARGNS